MSDSEMLVSRAGLVGHVIESIEGKRHKHYERTVELAELYMKLVTGKDINTLMRQFVRRESKAEFKQRSDITQHITSVICGNLMSPAYKVPRSNAATRVLTYDNGDDKRLDAFNEVLGHFWGNEDVDGWLSTRWIELNYVDPNSFVVIEWNAFDATEELAQPYPYEVPAKDAINFGFFNNVISWLVARSDVEVVLSTGKKTKDRYTGYGDVLAVVFTPSEDERLSVRVNNEKLATVDIDGALVDVYKSRIGQLYVISYPEPYTLGYVPAFRVGYKRDMQTDGQTFVSPIDNATPILMKTIKSVSEMDLSMALHAFPQKLQYVKRCANEGCYGGTIQATGIKCDICQGSGLKVQSSAQEIITLEMPRTKEELIELSNIIRYEYPPVDMLTFQDNYIKSLVAQCKEAIYNSDIYSKQEIAETATGKNISLQAVYDTLYPMALDYANEWVFITTTIADVTGMREGLIASLTFSKDFKMKGMDELYADMVTVGSSTTSNFIKQSIEDDIARVLYQDNPEQLSKHFTKQSFAPFSGMTPEQVVLLANSSLVPLRERLLWANFGWLFDTIERENPTFYELTRDKQRAIIDTHIEEIIKNMPEPPRPSFF